MELFEKSDKGDGDLLMDSTTDDTNSGNILDKRQISVISADMLKNKDNYGFVNLTSLVRIIHTTIDKGNETSTVRYFISSLPPNARRLAFVIRKHWTIESTLHQYLDVVFEEDKSKVKKDNSPLNLNILRKIALSLLLPLKQGRTSLKKMMFRASLEGDYLELVLFGM